jgi:GNAT superfamily N-acetyltransferase
MLEFRAANAPDVEAVVALAESAYRGENSRAGWTTEADLLDGQRTDAESVRALLERAGSHVLLGFEAGSLIACVHLQQAGSVLELGMFSVSPKLQNRGLGKLVLAEAERYAAEVLATRVIRMNVISLRSELIAFYARRGYTPTGAQAPFPYADPRCGQPKRQDLVFVVLEKTL